MIYVIALRQAARTGDRWQVLPRAYYSYARPWPTPAAPACDFRCWTSAQRADRQPKSYRTSIDGSAHAAGVMPARRGKPTAPRRGLFSAQ